MIVWARRQHRVLADMQRALLRSDPRLVGRFALFTRLTQEEDIPPFERVRGWLGRRAVMIVRHRPWDRRLRRLSGILIVPVLAAALAGLVIFTGGSHPRQSCEAARPAGSYVQPRRPPPREYPRGPGCASSAVLSETGGR